MRANLSRLLRAGKRYGTIVADPPWSFKDKSTRLSPEVRTGSVKYATHKYSGMSRDEIELMGGEVRALSKPQSHLYLWIPSALLLSHAALIFESWGFDFKQDLIWLKETVNGKRHMGGGHYFRHAHEVVLFGTRGKCPAKKHDMRDIFEAKTKGHSAKPEEFQDAVERISPGPYLELFARRKRDGWTTWGNQV